MRTNWKLLAGFSLFGGVISLISGIAGGNPFGVILLRLLLSAIVFGALGLGAQTVLRRYLPDLLRGAPRSEREPPGDSVDIIIDEELPVADRRESPEEAAPSAGWPGPEEALEGEEILPESPRGQVPEAFAGEWAGEEPVGSEPVGSEPGDVEPWDVEPMEAGSAIEPEAEELGEGPESGFASGFAAGRAGGAPPSGGGFDAEYAEAGDIEVLPEIDALGDGGSPFAGEPEEADPAQGSRPVRAAPPTRREMRQAQIEETVKDQDPENLARAVRTFLKKDQ